MSREFAIGLDIGTTSVKAVVFHLNGKVISENEKMIRFYYPQPNWVVQNPCEIELSAVQAVRDVMEEGSCMDNFSRNR